MTFRIEFIIIVFRILFSVNRLFKIKYDTIFVKRDHIGDFVLWMGCVQKYKENNKDKRICLICSKSNYEIAQQSGLFNHIIQIDNSIFQYLKLLGKRCSVLIAPTKSRTLKDDLVSVAISAKEKIAVKNDYTNSICEIDDNRIYNKIIEADVMPEIQLNTHIYNCIMNSHENNIYANLEVFISERVISEPYAVINLGSSNPARNWEINKFVELIERIRKKRDFLCVLVGGKNELELSNHFVSDFTGKTINMVGKTTLKEMISIVANSEFVISNDTSTVHVSAACEIPCIYISPGIHYGRFSEYPKADLKYRKHIPIGITSEKNKCFGCGVHNDNRMLKECELMLKTGKTIPCIRDISVEKVFNIIENELQQIGFNALEGD